MLPEDELVGLLAQVAGASPELLVGIGDDAAVLDGGLVVCVDALVDGVHFRSEALAARDIGLRAAAANLSDLAAMGARPLALLAAIGLPDGYVGVQELAAGIAGHGVPLAGGDLTRAPVLTVAVTALGRAARPVLRSGGQPGDRLVVSGPLGGQAASGYTLPVTPRLAEGAELALVAHAMIDLSDGIASDVRRLASASGTGAVVNLALLPRAPDATLEQAAAGGEDYELLAAVPPDAVLPAWATDVGELTEHPEVLLVDADGTARDLVGFDHFRR
jgi:thiamine-monophosphate kinase